MGEKREEGEEDVREGDERERERRREEEAGEIGDRRKERGEKK